MGDCFLSDAHLEGCGHAGQGSGGSGWRSLAGRRWRGCCRCCTTPAAACWLPWMALRPAASSSAVPLGAVLSALLQTTKIQPHHISHPTAFTVTVPLCWCEICCCPWLVLPS